jgi:cytochrome c oxidase subunit III
MTTLFGNSPALSAEHFENLEKQREAARFGMWLFLASETLLFAGLFALYAALRVRNPAAVQSGIGANDIRIGTLNTLILISSSFTVALSHLFLEADRRARSLACLATTIVLASLFLVLKATEYAAHIRHGILPGQTQFFTLYYMTTALHSLHVIAGMLVLTFLGIGIMRRTVRKGRAYPLELGTLYWHLVDVIWIFLWPLYYLGSHG